MMQSEPNVSFEFFPPKTETAEAGLMEALGRLAPLAPLFVSVTCGAGGSVPARTVETISRIRQETSLRAAAHLTCIGAARDEVDATAHAYWEQSVRHIVALRGDVPRHAGPYRPRANAYAYAADLVAGLKRIAPFEISVAAYPETHPEAPSRDSDLENLWRKVDAGADRAITQFFFDGDAFLRFRDRAAAAGIAAPLVPG